MDPMIAGLLTQFPGTGASSHRRGSKKYSFLLAQSGVRMDGQVLASITLRPGSWHFPKAGSPQPQESIAPNMTYHSLQERMKRA